MVRTYKPKTNRSRLTPDDFANAGALIKKGLSIRKELEPRIPSNLASAFRASGIYPLNPDPIIRQLNGQKTKDEIAESVSATFQAFLEEQIRGDPSPRKRRKKLQITPGRPVTEADVKALEAEVEKAKPKPTSGRRGLPRKTP